MEIKIKAFTAVLIGALLASSASSCSESSFSSNEAKSSTGRHAATKVVSKDEPVKKLTDDRKKASKGPETGEGNVKTDPIAVTCTLELSSSVIRRGDTFVLHYETTGAPKEVMLNGEAMKDLVRGSLTVVADQDLDYTMIVSDGSAESACGLQSRLVFDGPDPVPEVETHPTFELAPLCALTVEPAMAARGTPVTVTLAVNGNVSAASINGVMVDSLGGSLEFSPSGPTVFTANVVNAGGSATCSEIFTVQGEAPLPQPPTCRLEANANSIESANSVELTLTIDGVLTAAELDGDAAVNGAKKVVRPAASQAFTAKVSGPGGSATCSANVQVKDVPPPPAPDCTVVATPATITDGESATLAVTWRGAVASGSLAGHAIIASGHTESVKPSTSQVYVATVNGPGGMASCNASVTVGAKPVPAAPKCTLEPADQTITAGSTATITIHWSGSVTNAAIEGKPGSVDGFSKMVQPATSQAYGASVTGPGGTATCQNHVTVTPAPAKTFALSIVKTGLGSGAVVSGTGLKSGIDCGTDCTESYPASTVVSLSAAADSTSSFAGWGGACSGASPTCTVTMSAAQNVTASFNRLPAPICAMSPASQTIVQGGSAPLALQLSGAWTSASFAGVAINAASVNNSFAPQQTTTFSSTVSGPGGTTTCTALVTVTPKTPTTPPVVTFPLTVTKSGTGSGTVTASGLSCGADCSESFAKDTVVTLTEVATAGSTFIGWSGGCSGKSATCTFSMTQAQNVGAIFDLQPVPSYTIPSQLTCFYKATAGSNTVWGWVGGTGTNGGATRSGHFYQRRSQGAREEKYGNAETRFHISIGGVDKTFYLGSTVPLDPSQPIMARLEYYIPYQGAYGNETIRENILDTQSEVDIRRYFGVGAPVNISTSKTGQTGYWPISIGRDGKVCRQSDDPTWP